jgi:hypothetical protein
MRFILILLACGLCFACEPEEACVTDATNWLAVRFVQLDAENKVIDDTLVFEQIYAPGADTVFYQRKENEALISFSAYLSPESEETTLIFEAAEARDTLVLAYTQQFKLISPDCGLETRYTQLEVIRHTFTDARLLQSELRSRKTSADLELYY